MSIESFMVFLFKHDFKSPRFLKSCERRCRAGSSVFGNAVSRPSRPRPLWWGILPGEPRLAALLIDSVGNGHADFGWT
jgi:hypothetical protein